MIINENGKQRTANEFAKEMVMRYGQDAHNWKTRGQHSADYLSMFTVGEDWEIKAAIGNHLSRVSKTLGYPQPERGKSVSTEITVSYLGEEGYWLAESRQSGVLAVAEGCTAMIAELRCSEMILNRTLLGGCK